MSLNGLERARDCEAKLDNKTDLPIVLIRFRFSELELERAAIQTIGIEITMGEFRWWRAQSTLAL